AAHPRLRPASQHHAVAALSIATGKVTGTCQPRHHHREFRRFLKQVAKAYPDRELHLVMDNYAAHKRVESAAGCPPDQGCTCTSPRPQLPGSTLPKSGPASSNARPPRPGTFRSLTRTSTPRPARSSLTGTTLPPHSSGPRPQTTSSRKRTVRTL